MRLLNGGAGHERAAAGPARPGPETWDKARADDLAGLSGPQVCARYDLTESALRKRAEREGWRRGDQPDPQPPPAEAGADGDRAPAPAGDLVRQARLKLEDALSAGRALDAHRWLKMLSDLQALARAEADPPRQTPEAAAVSQALAALSAHENLKLAAKLRAELADKKAADADDAADEAAAEGDDVHPVLPEKPARPLNRHDRRKRARLTAWKAKHEARAGTAEDG